MPMAPFYLWYPDLATKETKVATIQGMEGLPDGRYEFVELFCNEPGCDCRRVVINVVRPDTGRKVWATFNFGWESTSFYRRWLRETNEELLKQAKGPALDPLNPQSEYSEALLEIFKVILQDKAYVQRLKRHYEMAKQAQASAARSSRGPETRVKRGRRP